LFQSCFGTPTDQPIENVLKQIWSYNYDIVGDAPSVVSGDTIYAPGGLYLFALNAEDGRLIWQKEIDTNSELKGQKLLIKDNQIVANHLESIRSWNRETGELFWEYTYSDELEPRRNGNHTNTDIGFVFCAFRSQFFVLDLTGKELFSKKLDENFGVLGVTSSENRFYLSQRNTINGALTLGRITALDANGDSLWAYNTENGGFFVSSYLEENLLYVGTQGNSSKSEVVTLNIDNGGAVWKYITEDPKEFSNSILVTSSKVIFRANGRLVALDKTSGKKEWQFDWLGTATVDPVYLGGYVYHSDNFTIYVFEEETGNLVHEEPVPDGGFYFWHLTVSEDKLFAQTSSQLIAYQPWHLRDD